MTDCLYLVQFVKHQEVSQMQMRYTIIVVASNTWSHRNHIFGIIIFLINTVISFIFDKTDKERGFIDYAR